MRSLGMKWWIWLVALGLVGCNQCSGGKDSGGDSGAALTGDSVLDRDDVKKAIESGKFEMIDVAGGEGPAIADGKRAIVHYTGWLTTGKKFDSSRDRSETFSFQVGAGQVINGWDQGVKGMKSGAKRILVIPPELGYGSRTVGDGLIPANSTLVFEVELVRID